MHKLRNELRKIQSVNREAEEEVKNYEARLKVSKKFLEKITGRLILSKRGTQPHFYKVYPYCCYLPFLFEHAVLAD